MRALDYLADRAFAFACFAAAEALVFGLLWLVEVPLVFILFAGGIFLAAFAAALLRDFFRKRRYYGRLLALLDQMDEKTLLMEVAGRPAFPEARVVAHILQCSGKYLNDQLAEQERQSREYREFLDAWVHEIKTPIAAARLIVENDKNPTTLKLDGELRRVDALVELVLYYARSGDVEKDFRVESTTLQALVHAALKACSRPIIQAGGQVQTDGLDVPVCADRKSCVFILWQILTNAVKYRQGALRLEISGKAERNRALLTIRDNGTGIDAADLPRVFDKGFTGQNGRRFPHSTGIGLYLCRELCRKMNMEIAIDSEKGRGTAVTLAFPTESMLQGAGL